VCDTQHRLPRTSGVDARTSTYMGSMAAETLCMYMVMDDVAGG